MSTTTCALDQIKKQLGGKMQPNGTIELEVRQVMSSFAISTEEFTPEDYKITAHYSCELKRIIFELQRLVLAEHLEHVETYDTWWDHFKGTSRWCPKWIRRRYQPNKVIYDLHAYYPQLSVKGENRLQWKKYLK